MNISALLMTLCSLCFSTPATAGDTNRSQECFASPSQAWMIHPGQHLYRHKTPNGMCWHIGKKNHSGVFASIPKENGTVGKRMHTGRTTGLASWRVPQQWNVYPEFQRWPKFYDIERTKEFQEYGGPPVRYSDPWK